MGEVIITAGGTREKIDDVRYIGNFSGGRLGHAIATIYAKYTDNDVLFIAPKETIERFGKPDGVTHESFSSAQELREKLLGISAVNTVIHSAAVADYTPVFHEGKISSDQDELVIHLKRTPKIISELRDHFGESTKLVGFKLLSGATKKELFLAAARQIDDNRLDFCIANNIGDIRPNPYGPHWTNNIDTGPIRTVHIMGDGVSGGKHFDGREVYGNTYMVGAEVVSIVEHESEISWKAVEDITTMEWG